jgi:hypothetical protein
LTHHRRVGPKSLLNLIITFDCTLETT